MRKLATLTLSLLISGCLGQSAQIEDDFATYLSRIANVQGIEPLATPTTRYTRLPAVRDIKFALSTTSLGLLDSYQLRHCQLFQLIAEKNSILGKVQDEFRDYDYQRQLIIGLGRCIENPAISATLKSQLAEIQAIKFKQLPHRLSNVMFTSQAMRTQLEAHDWLTEADFSHSSQVIHAFVTLKQSHLTTLKSATLSTAPIHITPVQQTLETMPMTGKLDYSLSNASAWLNVLNDQLEQYDARIMCGANRNNTQLNYLTNVFSKFYLAKLQPYLARINGLYFQYQPVLTLLNQTHPSYRYPLEQHYQQFKVQTQRHVKYWQQLFKRCHVNLGGKLNLSAGG